VGAEKVPDAPEGNGESVTLNLLNHIPLNSAYLCQDCDSVGNNSMRCPACGSGVLMGLAGVFDRREESAAENLILFPALAA
jgi:hypothetical protein